MTDDVLLMRSLDWSDSQLQKKALEISLTHVQVKRSLDWLRGESQGNRRYASVLILREMAENAPAVFNVHVKAFIDIVWVGLRDAKVIVREASVAALRVSELCQGSVPPGSAVASMCILRGLLRLRGLT